MPSPEKIFRLLVSMECNKAGEGGGVIAISREDIPAAGMGMIAISRQDISAAGKHGVMRSIV